MLEQSQEVSTINKINLTPLRSIIRRKPYGEDNFIFTHPETGNPTLYNPDTRLKIPLIGDVPVPDLGDIASISREVYQTAGSSVGLLGSCIRFF